MFLQLLRPLAFLIVAAGLGTAVYSQRQTANDFLAYSPNPGACGSAAECSAYCASHPYECRSYCGIDSAHASECAGWTITITNHLFDEGSCKSSGCTWSNNSCDCSNMSNPTSGGSTYPSSGSQSSEESCRQMSNCSWTGSYCQCGMSTSNNPPSTGGSDPAASPYASEANCRATMGCSWSNGACGCIVPGSQPQNESSCRATLNCIWEGQYCNCDPSRQTPQTNETVCNATSNCSWVNNACSCISNSQRPQTRSECEAARYPWCETGGGTGSCDIERRGCYSGGGNTTPPSSESCKSSGYNWCVSANGGGWCDYSRYGCTSTGPGGGGSCALAYPTPRSDNNCRSAVTSYIGCTTTYEDQREYERLVAECLAGGNPVTPPPTPPPTPVQCPSISCSESLVSCTLPGSSSPCPACTTRAACGITTPPTPIRPRECGIPRCSILEVTCNPPDDGDECAICMTPQACRSALDGRNRPPQPPPQPPSPITPPPGPIGPPVEVPRPECRTDEDCARFCNSGDRERGICGEYCKAEFAKPECQRWADAYSRVRGGRVGPPGPGEERTEDLAQMKRQFRDWIRDFKNVTGRINRIKAKKVTIPEDVLGAVATIQGMASRVEAAASTEDLRALGDELQNAIQIINDALPDLERLQEFSRYLRDVNRQVSRTESDFKRLERRAKAKKIDHPILAEIAGQISEAKQNRDAAVAAAAAGKGDEAFESLENVRTALDEIREKFIAVEVMISAPRELGRATRELGVFKRDLDRLRRRGADIAEANVLLASLNEKLAAIRELTAQIPFPVEEVIAGIEDFEDTKDQFLILLDDLRGTRRDTFPQPVPGPFPLELPPGFEVEVPKDVFGIQ